MPKAKKTDLPLITADFGREDLNALRDTVNALVEHVNNS